MGDSSARLVEVSGDEMRLAATRLINEYLSWVAGVARMEYGLTFDIEGMAKSDIEDASKFYPPNGRFYLVRVAGRYIGVAPRKRAASR